MFHILHVQWTLEGDRQRVKYGERSLNRMATQKNEKLFVAIAACMDTSKDSFLGTPHEIIHVFKVFDANIAFL